MGLCAVPPDNHGDVQALAERYRSPVEQSGLLTAALLASQWIEGLPAEAYADGPGNRWAT